MNQVIHKFDQQIGPAPYRLICIISLPGKGLAADNPNAYQQATNSAFAQAKNLGVSICSCDYCGNSLLNNFVVQNADGGRFVLGCDCASKIGDTKLATEVEVAERDRRRELAEKRREAKWAKQAAERQADQQAERDRNGGLTDWELAEKRKKDARDAAAAINEAKYGPLLDVLRAGSDWCQDVARSISEDGWDGISERAQGTCFDVYGKSGGRRGSKANKAKQDELEAILKATK